MPDSLLFLIWFLVSSILAVAVLITILISGIVSSTHGASYVPIKRRYVRLLLSWASLSAKDIFYDLGCGDARVLISAVKDFGVKKALGYEVALWPYLEARFAIWSSGISDRAVVYHQNFFSAKGGSASGGKTDLAFDRSNATFVYAYLFPKLVGLIASKLAHELVSGSKILCPSFPIDLMRHPEFKLLKSEKIAKITAYLYERI